MFDGCSVCAFTGTEFLFIIVSGLDMPRRVDLLVNAAMHVSVLLIFEGGVMNYFDILVLVLLILSGSSFLSFVHGFFLEIGRLAYAEFVKRRKEKRHGQLTPPTVEGIVKGKCAYKLTSKFYLPPRLGLRPVRSSNLPVPPF